MADRRARVVFIAGPTASGKSRAALYVARAAGAEIVNADALQVYADLEILSARPRGADLAAAPHHLFGALDGALRSSAGRWSREAAATLAEIAARGAPAIVVGGTGLYFRALEEGLSPIPEIAGAHREAAQARFNEIGAEAFRAEVVARDPAMARLGASDRQRLLRADEVHRATGRRLSEWQQVPRAPMIPGPFARIVIEPERAALNAALDARFDRMLAEGAIEEARRLLARDLDPGLPVMKALGAAELMAHLRGEISLDAAIALAKGNTRRFAKRQSTWFRTQAPHWLRAGDWRSAAQTALSSLQSDPSAP